MRQNRKGFVSIVCRPLKVKERWDVANLSGSQGDYWFFGDKIQVHQIVKTDFNIELEVEGEGCEGKSWVI